MQRVLTLTEAVPDLWVCTVMASILLGTVVLFFLNDGPEVQPDEGCKISSCKTSVWLWLPASLGLLTKILQQVSVLQSWTLTIPAKECQKCCWEQIGTCNNTGIHWGITQKQSPGTGMIIPADANQSRPCCFKNSASFHISYQDLWQLAAESVISKW